MQSSHRILNALLLASLAACGSSAPGDDDGDDDGPPPPPPMVDANPPSMGSLEAFCADDGPFARIFAKTYECLPNLSFLAEFRPTAADLGALCTARYEDFVLDGTLSFAGGDVWDDCVAYAADLTCTTVSNGHLGACEDVFVGTVETGDYCRIDEHCAGAAWCDDGGDGCAKCAPQRADGMSCFSSDSCLSGNCGTGGCRGFGGVDAACGATYDCVGHLICEDSHCTAPVAYQDGTPCGLNSDCGANSNGLWCDAGTCRPMKQVGDECTLNACNYYEYEHCDVDGTGKCVAPTIGGVGAECDMFQGKACATGLLCSAPDFGDGVCYQPRGDGEACSNTDPQLGCGFGLRCVLFTCTAADEPVCLNP